MFTEPCTVCETWRLVLRAPRASPGDLPNPGIEPWSPAFQADTLIAEPPAKPLNRAEFKFTHGQPAIRWFFSVRHGSTTHRAEVGVDRHNPPTHGNAEWAPCIGSFYYYIIITQLLKPVPHNKRSHCGKKPTYCS